MDSRAIAMAGGATAGHSGCPASNQASPVATPVSKWEAFGRAVLGFHVRVGRTAMCQCGATMRACDVWAQAAQYGIRRPPE